MRAIDFFLGVWYNLAYLINTFWWVIHESEEDILAQWLPAIRVVQIILSITVVIFILLQARGAGLGSAFGGSSAGSVFKTRRGVERLIFNLTVVFVILFALVSLISALLR